MPKIENSHQTKLMPIQQRLKIENKPKTYSQDWIAYNRAQTQEKLLFMELLYELTSTTIPRPKRNGAGRPSANFGEMVFACCLKTYLDFSSRRSESDIKLAQRLGYVQQTPHFNTILKYLHKPVLTEILTNLITISALPLKEVEENFTVDASGFSTIMFGRWADVRTRERSKRRLFKKVHVMSGVNTNTITHIQVTDGYVSDSLIFPILVKNTAQNFQMKEVSADKAYSSRNNLGIVSSHGAIPFIPFKKNATKKSKGTAIWYAMYEYSKYHKEDFMKHYHLRSNAESVFSMVKRKFGDNLRTRNDISQTNEVLCKALCHNICVLIQEMFELGIKIDFSEASEEFMCKIRI